MSLLGIDIGSSCCKGIVFSTSGMVLASHNHSYSTLNVGPSMVEIDGTIFREAVFNIIRKLSSQVQDDPIEALAISSHGETTIPIDKNGNTSGPAIMNSDNRAEEEAEWWAKTFGKEKIYKITGVPLHAMFTINKIIWIKKHRPEIYLKTDRFLSVGDYILTQMGLPPYTDFSLASRTMAFDIKNLCWSEEILHHCNIPEERLGIPVASGTIAGRLSKGIALDLGLKEGTVVALGGHDQPCGALGAGAINDGDVSNSAGSYECMAAVSEKPLNNSKAFGYSLNSYCHVVPGKFVTLAFFPAGIVSSWFIGQFCFEDKIISKNENKDFFELMYENTLKFCPGPTGLCVTPHFVGSCTPYWDVRATGVMTGFTPNTTRYHIYKAIYEGIACELAINVCALEDVFGGFTNMSINGGNSRSLFTVQLRADITGKTIQLLKNDEAVCLGAAILAGISVGVYKDAEDAVIQVVQIEKTIRPNSIMQSEYEKQIEQYKIVYQSLDRFRKI
jgi:xylulokinase